MLGWRVRCRYFSCFFRSWCVWRRSSGPAGARVCLRLGASCLRLRSFDGCHGQVRRCLSGWLTVVVGEGAAVECLENTCAGRMTAREEQTTKNKKRGSTQQKKGKQKGKRQEEHRLKQKNTNSLYLTVGGNMPPSTSPAWVQVFFRITCSLLVVVLRA